MILIVNVITVKLISNIPNKVNIRNHIGNITHIQLIGRISTNFRKASRNVK